MVETSCRVEPPRSSCRRRLQTAQRCFGKEPWYWAFGKGYTKSVVRYW